MSEPTNEPEVEVVQMTCLHCRLSDVLDEWMEEYEQKVGEPPGTHLIGHYLGALIEDISQEVHDQLGQDEVYALRDAVTRGQMEQRQRLAAEEAKRAEPVTEPNPNTKH